MSFYEGKNCFRNAFVQRPVYSGHCNISAAKINFPILVNHNKKADEESTATATRRVQVELLVTANGPTLNVLHRSSGQVLCTRDVGLDSDDLILHIDTIVVPPPSCATGASTSAAAAAAPAQQQHDGVGNNDVDDEDKRGEVLLYIAASTRGLQICVFALRAVATLADEKKLTARRLLRLQEREKHLQRFTAVSVDVPVDAIFSDIKKNEDNDEDNDDDAQKKNNSSEASYSSFSSSSAAAGSGGGDGPGTYTLSVPLAVALVPLKQWTADQSAISCLKFSPHTFHLASGSADAGLKVWSVLNHYLTHQFRGTGGVVTTLAFLNEDESLLAAGTFEGYLSVIDFSAKKVIASGRKHTASVEAISLTTTTTSAATGASRGGNSKKGAAASAETGDDVVLLITASRDRTVSVMEAKSLRVLRTIAVGHPLLACCFISPFVGVYGCDNGIVAAFSVSPHTFGVVIFAVRDAPKSGAEEEHSVRSIAYLRNEKIEEEIRAAAEREQQEQQQQQQTKSSPSATRRQRASAETTSKAVVTSAAAAAVATTVHSLLTETVLVADASYRLFSFSAHVSQKNNNNNNNNNNSDKTLSSAFSSGTLTAPTGATLRCDQTDVLNFDQIMDVKFFPTFGLLHSDEKKKQTVMMRGGEHQPISSGGNHDELVLATNARDCYVTAGSNSSRLRGALSGHTDIVVSVDIDPTGKRILTASKDTHCRVWCADTLACLGVSSDGVHSAELTCARFITTGNNSNLTGLDLACTISFDSVLAIWSLSSSNNSNEEDSAAAAAAAAAAAVKKISTTTTPVLSCISSIAGSHDGPTYCVAVAPNGQFIATGGKDKSVQVFSLRGKRIARVDGAPLKGHRRTVSSVAFSPVDRLLASGSNDGSVRVWSLATMACMRTMQADAVPVLQLAFFNKGTQIVTSNSDGVTRFWATAAGECVAVSAPHGDRAWALCVREHEEERSADLFDQDSSSSSSSISDDDDDAAAADEQQGDDEEDEEQETRKKKKKKIAKKSDNTRRATKTVSRIFILTGSADGTLVCQEDFTDERVELLREERAATTQKEQQLRNTIRQGDYGAAFTLALTLNHPRHLRGVLTEWMGKTASAMSAAAKIRRQKQLLLENGDGNDGDVDEDEAALEALVGIRSNNNNNNTKNDDDAEKQADTINDDDDDPCEKQVAQIVAKLANNQLHRLFSFARLWLTNAKHCGAASLVVAATLRGLHPLQLEGLAAFAEVSEALLAYSKRHLARLRRSLDQLHFLEYLTKGSLDDSGPAVQAAAAVTAAAATSKTVVLDQALSVAAAAAAAKPGKTSVSGSSGKKNK